ncbi:hypothetical protein [Saccharothrix australiensis]|uniref:Uncharacterized protein n=1 Tax=Saccharothrix australiensis TaxID=2072 RepID=A0A495W2D4_9PSEU|nr:hypothetical protein [Saccharothrix australiensis]RKT55300.1 hypothetical protein C8E97_3962 [Saccharothrix australiensis]
MEHPHGGLDAVVETSAWPVALRLTLLLATAFVAGVGVVRPLAPALPRRVVLSVAVASALSAALAVVSAVAMDVAVVGAVAHVVLVAAVPALLGRAGPARAVAVALAVLLVVETAAGRSGVEFVADTVYVAGAVTWFGLAVLALTVPAAEVASGLRPRQLALALGVALVGAGAVRLVASGVAFDRRLYGTWFGLALLAVVALPLAATLLGPARAYRYGTVGVVLAFVAWSGLAAVPRPDELPTPGVPVLAEKTLAGKRVPVLVAPHRPGRNLVHFPASAGDGIRVGAVPALPRAGAEGTWAEVDLPAGRSEIVLTSGSDTAVVDVDTGAGGGPRVDPECASAALGGLIAGRRDVLAACPSDRLSTVDEQALRKLVSFLVARGAGGITLAADSTPRGVDAARVVREEAAGAGVAIDAEPRPDNALVTVSGWESAHASLTAAGAHQAERAVYAHGVYLAPWLLTTPLATAVTTVSVPLRFDPREPLPIGYAVAVGNRFGGANPTPAGFEAWLGDRAVDDGVRIFAAAQVTAMPAGPDEAHGPGMPMNEELAGQWVPKTTVVPVSALLT